jgi:hypothetical protein
MTERSEKERMNTARWNVRKHHRIMRPIRFDGQAATAKEKKHAAPEKGQFCRDERAFEFMEEPQGDQRLRSPPANE